MPFHIKIKCNLFAKMSYRRKIRNKSGFDKIKDFFECYRLIDDVSDIDFSKQGFINSSDVDSVE